MSQMFMTPLWGRDTSIVNFDSRHSVVDTAACPSCGAMALCSGVSHTRAALALADIIVQHVKECSGGTHEPQDQGSTDEGRRIVMCQECRDQQQRAAQEFQIQRERAMKLEARRRELLREHDARARDRFFAVLNRNMEQRTGDETL